MNADNWAAAIDAGEKALKPPHIPVGSLGMNTAERRSAAAAVIAAVQPYIIRAVMEDLATVLPEPCRGLALQFARAATSDVEQEPQEG